MAFFLEVDMDRREEFWDGEGVWPYITGEWAVEYSAQPMPFDGVQSLGQPPLLIPPLIIYESTHACTYYDI